MKHLLTLGAILLLLVSAAAAAGPINGQIVFEKNGGPVPQARIDFSSASQKARAVTSDDGSYYVPDLPSGLYEVTITYRGAQHKFRRQIPEQGVIFRLKA